MDLGVLEAYEWTLFSVWILACGVYIVESTL